ncbi:anti-sigma factor antagonist [Kribbella sp. NPDC051770]|uniref:STAS domain-containing protein n=1 Tax=Kribbella sp. NPDC051770 TaxID=3155413 RepID=UPI0034195596
MLTDDETSFTLELDTSGPGPLVRVCGDLDLETAPELTGLLKTLLGAHPIVVDLAEVEFMDSSGLGVLVGAHKESLAHGGALVVVGPRPRIQKILRITKLDKVFTVYPTLDGLTAVLAEQQLAAAGEGGASGSAEEPSSPPQVPGSAQMPDAAQMPDQVQVPSSTQVSDPAQMPGPAQEPRSSNPPGAVQAPGSAQETRLPHLPDAPSVPYSPEGRGASPAPGVPQAEGPPPGRDRDRG